MKTPISTEDIKRIIDPSELEAFDKEVDEAREKALAELKEATIEGETSEMKSRRVIKAMMRHLFEMSIRFTVLQVCKRHKEVEQRLAALEARQIMSYRGIWKADASYRAGNIATHAGALWFAWLPTHETPGKSDDWQLMHNSPRSER